MPPASERRTMNKSDYITGPLQDAVFDALAQNLWED